MNTELIEQCAKRLHITPTCLETQLQSLPTHHLAHIDELLYVANRYELDPLTQEVILIKDREQIRPYITMDGWMRLMNQLPHFCGVQFRDATELIDGIPLYVECSIYRDDRILPICIREYYAEVRQEWGAWQDLPHRMLRHKALQQALRLAFGISTLERPTMGSESSLVETVSPVTTTTPPKKKTEQLKELLQVNHSMSSDKK